MRGVVPPPRARPEPVQHHQGQRLETGRARAAPLPPGPAGPTAAAPPLASSGSWAGSWVSSKGVPSPSQPPAQACLLGSIVPRGSVQCK